jgi:DNA-binding GntR family transcriptional regulator
MLAQSLGSNIATSVVVYLHAQLKERVMSGALAPGEVLRQEHIADEFNVSVAPVREALKAMQAEGLINFRPRRGYVVSDLEPEEIEDIFDIRAMLEGRAGHLAASNRSSADIAEVAALFHRLNEITIVGPEDIAQWAKANRDFHGRIFASSGKNHLCRMTNVLRDTVERYVRVDASVPGRTAEAAKEHAEIFRAFERGDTLECERLSREHCEHTSARLIAVLKSHRDGDSHQHRSSTKGS